MIGAMNAGGVPIVAVDLPSGVNGTSGAIMGVAVNATRTVTFFRRKTGHLLLPGRLHCGTVEVADIGIPESVLDKIKPRTFANAPQLWGGMFPKPRSQGHKYSRGHAVVVSGGLSTTGAARLAARAALRAGAGLVTIASPREALAINAAASLAVMVRPVDGAAELAEFLTDKRRNAIVLGPGGGIGIAMREQVLTALASHAVVVLDADALTSFAEEPEVLVSAIGRRGGQGVVITPHEGEFLRIFNHIIKKTNSSSKLEKTLLAAEYSGAVVVYKEHRGQDGLFAWSAIRASPAAPPPCPTRRAAGDASPGDGHLFQGDGAAHGRPAARSVQTFNRKANPRIYIANGHGAWEAVINNASSARREGAGAAKRPLRGRLGQRGGRDGRRRRSPQGRLAPCGPARRGRSAPQAGTGTAGSRRSWRFRSTPPRAPSTTSRPSARRSATRRCFWSTWWLRSVACRSRWTPQASTLPCPARRRG